MTRYMLIATLSALVLALGAFGLQQREVERLQAENAALRASQETSERIDNATVDTLTPGAVDRRLCEAAGLPDCDM